MIDDILGGLQEAILPSTLLAILVGGWRRGDDCFEALDLAVHERALVVCVLLLSVEGGEVDVARERAQHVELFLGLLPHEEERVEGEIAEQLFENDLIKDALRKKW